MLRWLIGQCMRCVLNCSLFCWSVGECKGWVWLPGLCHGLDEVWCDKVASHFQLKDRIDTVYSICVYWSWTIKQIRTRIYNLQNLTCYGAWIQLLLCFSFVHLLIQRIRTWPFWRVLVIVTHIIPSNKNNSKDLWFYTICTNSKIKQYTTLKSFKTDGLLACTPKFTISVYSTNKLLVLLCRKSHSEEYVIVPRINITTW